ncbi:SDR family oxidoreductase [Azospirillum doebereinerae]|uniref:SDR family oxidoreductase n=1 Tax=Azospirillum doebereinerae TaxID=92933 RepID=UPI002687E818
MTGDSGMLAGKAVVVTGAGRGIGREIALEFARHGARVVVNDLGVAVNGTETDGESPAGEVVRRIREAGGEAVANADSVADWAGAHRIVETALDHFGRIDAVVNNAGILRDGMFHKMTEEDFDAVMGVHLKGAFNVARAAAPHFRKQQSGAYVHMTSNSALIGNLGQANYMAAKLGVVGLSRSIALDMQAFGVRSNCVSPSAATRMGDTVPVATEEQRLRAQRRLSMTADRIAPLAVFLASDAARDVNGQIFAVRRNEVFLMSQSRPLRALHRSEGGDGGDAGRPSAAGASPVADAARPCVRRLRVGSGVTDVGLLRGQNGALPPRTPASALPASGDTPPSLIRTEPMPPDDVIAFFSAGAPGSAPEASVSQAGRRTDPAP